MGRVLVVHRDLGHQRVQSDRARMVGDDERATLAGYVLDAADLDPEPRLVQRAQQRQVDVLGEVLVETELVDGVVPGEAPTDEGQDVGDLTFDVVAENA
jgi:hypothetical protein